MKKKAPAKRQRIPAFGEWNYAYVGAGDDDWSVTQYFESAGVPQAGRLVMAAIPPPSPAKPAANKVVKWRESATHILEPEDDEKQQQHVVVVGLGEHGGEVAKKQGKQQSSVAAHARVHASSAYKASCRVGTAATVKAKAMDQDLYHIPPDMLCHEPRKRLTTRRSLWMGCLGLNCVA